MKEAIENLRIVGVLGEILTRYLLNTRYSTAVVGGCLKWPLDLRFFNKSCLGCLVIVSVSVLDLKKSDSYGKLTHSVKRLATGWMMMLGRSRSKGLRYCIWISVGASQLNRLVSCRAFVSRSKVVGARSCTHRHPVPNARTYRSLPLPCHTSSWNTNYEYARHMFCSHCPHNAH